MSASKNDRIARFTSYLGAHVTRHRIERAQETVLIGRVIERLTETIGPRHDPYARETWTVTELRMWPDGSVCQRTVELVVCALAGLSVLRDGQLVQEPTDDSKVAIRKFEELVGISLEQIESAYWRGYREEPGSFYGEA